MKLYIDPVSTTCRPILMFLADHHMSVEVQPVDLFAGEQLQPAFAALNPNCAVPLLVDGDWRLTEGSSILRHLADANGSPTYPTGLRERSAVNSAMDWFNTGFYRDFGYHYVYPQTLPQYALPADGGQEALLAMGLERSRRWLDVLDRHMLAGRDYVAGGQPSLADYFGAAYVSLGDWIGFDLSAWPAVVAWLARMRARPAVREVWAEHDRFAAAMRARLAAPAGDAAAA